MSKSETETAEAIDKMFEELWATLGTGFMFPDIQELSRADISESNAHRDPESKLGRAGWYARLSAPGYPDCTDWSGPFESPKEAGEYLIKTFAD